jgi:GT2 family glycosyltransferase
MSETETETKTGAAAFGGYLDFWGDTGDPGRSLLCGWLGHPWRAVASGQGLALRMHTAGGIVQTQALGLVFARADIAAIGFGVLLLADAPAAVMDGLRCVDVTLGQRQCRMTVAPAAQALDRMALREAAHPLLLRAAPVDHRRVALACLEMGEDGYAGAEPRVTLRVDAVLDCTPAGALILGSLRTAEPDIGQATLVCGGERRRVAPERLALGPMTAHGDQAASVSVACLADPGAPRDGERWLEVALAGGLVARTRLPATRRADRAALLDALAAFGAARDADAVFDHVAGPAIGALHAAARAVPARTGQAAFGRQPAAPHASLVIPLHRRIDYMEVQLALFSAQACMVGAEIVYVVDDPPLQEAALAAAEGACRRLGVACRLVLPRRTLGFAGASNAGLRAARGRFVCFMNSDVFAGPPDWLTRLIARLEADPRLGLVGPMLLFPDGAVQHQGMVLEPVAERASWSYPRHVGKGLRPRGAGLAACDAITGACMVLRRALAETLGGFDEAFVVGDFEDADLCARAAALGLGCAVDADVRLVHLERKSQGADAPWRAGATLYNAWLHQRRWLAPAPPAALRARGRKRA